MRHQGVGPLTDFRGSGEGSKLRPLARQVPKRDAKVILLSVPCPERVPPLILRLVTRCRRLRSAALLSEGTAGSDTKTNSEVAPAELGLNRQGMVVDCCGGSLLPGPELLRFV